MAPEKVYQLQLTLSENDEKKAKDRNYIKYKAYVGMYITQ